MEPRNTFRRTLIHHGVLKSQVAPIYLLFNAILYPAWGCYFQYLDPGTTDSMRERWGVSAVAVCIILASRFSTAVTKHLRIITYAYALMVTVHLFVLTFNNGFNHFYK